MFFKFELRHMHLEIAPAALVQLYQVMLLCKYSVMQCFLFLL